MRNNSNNKNLGICRCFTASATAVAGASYTIENLIITCISTTNFVKTA